MFRDIGFGKPVKLIVGGLHGNEGIVTEHILREILNRVHRVKLRGRLILCNLTKKEKYISTLCATYYQTDAGKRLLSLIRNYKPEIYIELHSYGKKAYSKLTHPRRKEFFGVPPLVDLEDGILLGSISPHIRTSEFRNHDLCLTLEIPKDLNGDTERKVIKILTLAITSHSQFVFLERLREMYPSQIRIAEKDFYEYFNGIKPFGGSIKCQL